MIENKDNFFVEVLKFSLLTLLIVLPFRMFIAKPFIVNGASMSPTFETGHYLIVDQVSYKINEPERGDIIVFKYPNDQTRFFIKRIVGLPRETIIIKNGEVTIKNDQFPDGFTLEEDYVKNIAHKNMSQTLSEDEYFVMGDNRANSSDSRTWGALEKNFIIGKAFVRLFPITQMDLFPGKFTY
ncbi:signal peptidase I [Patescibacteria group bacterium]|nr:signal peptidase I [Patescibacteria group bacterium]